VTKVIKAASPRSLDAAKASSRRPPLPRFIMATEIDLAEATRNWVVVVLCDRNLIPVPLIDLRVLRRRKDSEEKATVD
jgi:hypothetical protein